jgi:hypothetical protein
MLILLSMRTLLSPSNLGCGFVEAHGTSGASIPSRDPEKPHIPTNILHIVSKYKIMYIDDF